MDNRQQHPLDRPRTAAQPLLRPSAHRTLGEATEPGPAPSLTLALVMMALHAHFLRRRMRDEGKVADASAHLGRGLCMDAG